MFSSYQGTATSSIVRLNADGSLDTSFNPGNLFPMPVKAVAIQDDGKILVASLYTNTISRLNVDGSLDASVGI
jgi:hypothetical protein